MIEGSLRCVKLTAAAVMSMAVVMALLPPVDGLVIQDVMEQILAEGPTCIVYGWVNDSATTLGIDGASVAMIPDDYWGHNTTSTNDTGYYEMEMACGNTTAVFYASGYYQATAQFDTVGQTEYRLDMSLDPEPTVPTISMELDPIENVSLHRPLVTHVTSEDFNIMAVEAFFGPVLDRSDDGVNISVLAAKAEFVGSSSGSDDFVYTYEDDLFDGVCTWTPTADYAGYIMNSTGSQYVICRSISSINDVVTYGIYGLYWNETLEAESGLAYFDNATGAYLGFEFMNVSTLANPFAEPALPSAPADDPYGSFAPVDLFYPFRTVHNDYGDTYELIGTWYGEDVKEQMSVTELSFEYTNVVPSGDYAVAGVALDEALNMNITVGFFTVDVDPPVAEAGEDQEVMTGADTLLSSSGSYDNVGISEYQWSFEDDGDSVTLTGEEVTYAFTDTGDHVVTLIVRDGGYNEGSDTVIITVTDGEDPVADAGEDLYVEVGESVTLDGAGSSDNIGIVNYTWSCDDGGHWEAYGQTVERTFDTEGTYTISLVVYDAADNSATDSLTVHVSAANEAPAADAGEDIDAEVGDTVQLDGTGSSDDEAIVNYTWTFEYDGETVKLYGESVEFTFNEAGTYMVNLTVADGDGLKGYDEVTITVAERSHTLEYALFAGVALTAVVAAIAVFMVSKRKGKAA